MRTHRGVRMPGSTVLHELREGWHDFWSRTWLWVIVLQFGDRQRRRERRRPGARPGDREGRSRRRRGVGRGPDRIVGRPRPLRAHDAALAAAPDPARRPPSRSSRSRSAARARGPGAATRRDRVRVRGRLLVEIFGVLWDTAMQQEIPPEKLSRLYSYDALGSWVLMPVALRRRRADRSRGRHAGRPHRLRDSGARRDSAVLLSRDVRTLERRSTAPAVPEPVGAV